MYVVYVTDFTCRANSNLTKVIQAIKTGLMFWETTGIRKVKN